MTERDYILTTSLARVEAARHIIGKLCAADPWVHEDEWKAVCKTLERWNDRLYKEVDRPKGKAKPTTSPTRPAEEA